MARVINPAEFRQVIQFNGFTKAPDSSGGNDEQYDGYYTTRAKVEFMDGSRTLETGMELMVSVWKITCFWRHNLESVLNTNTRIMYDNRTLRIESVERVGQNRQYYRFIASEAH